jgi:hypothetical protein
MASRKEFFLRALQLSAGLSAVPLAVNQGVRGRPLHDELDRIEPTDGVTVEVLPQWWGARADGSTDDTSAVQAAIDFAARINDGSGGAVRLVPGIYMIRQLQGRGRTSLLGGVSNAGTSQQGNVVLRHLSDGTTEPGDALLDLTGQSQVTLRGITFDAVSRGRGIHGLKAGSRMVLEDCLFHECQSGIHSSDDGNYLRQSFLRGCKFQRCSNGLRGASDCYILQCHFISNASNGIHLITGANDNVIVGGKADWNGRNINLSEANNNVIVGMIIDRASTRGISIRGGRNNAIVGCQLRRNGRRGGPPQENTHILLDSTADVVVSGCVTRSGADDDGSGLVAPRVALVARDVRNGAITGNVLTGAVDEAVLLAGSNEAVRLVNNVPGDADSLLYGPGSVQPRPVDTGVIEPSKAASVRVGTLPTPAFQVSRRTLRLAARDMACGTPFAASVPLLVNMGEEAMEVVLGRLENEIGSAFSTGTDRLKVEIGEVEGRGAALEVRITNQHPSPHRVWLDVI